MKKRLRELEEAVVDAWPAADAADLDGWLLRASAGPSRRGNSVATLEAGSELELVERIQQAESWYRARNQRPMFQVGPCALPAGLDQTLAERGYLVEGEAIAALAHPADVAERTASRLATSVALRPSAAWLEIGLRASRFAESPDSLLGFFRRLGSRCRFVLAHDAEGVPAACCIAISSEDRLGIYAMLTLPHMRRKGAACALLHAVANEALRERMRELYLLVEAENQAARALYARSGFQDLYTYHYRALAPS